MGVGEKPKEWDLADYVLGHFSGEERKVMDRGIEDAVKAMEIMVTEGPDKAMNLFNKKQPGGKTKQPDAVELAKQTEPVSGGKDGKQEKAGTPAETERTGKI